MAARADDPAHVIAQAKVELVASELVCTFGQEAVRDLRGCVHYDADNPCWPGPETVAARVATNEAMDCPSSWIGSSSAKR